jgi:hypothetical protein
MDKEEDGVDSPISPMLPRWPTWGISQFAPTPVPASPAAMSTLLSPAALLDVCDVSDYSLSMIRYETEVNSIGTHHIVR